MKDCLWLWHFFLFQNRVYEGKVEVEMTAERRWPDGDVTGSFVNSRICGPLSHFRIMKKKSSNKCTLHILCPFDRDRMKRSITLTSCVGPKRSSCTKRPCSSLCWLVYAKLTQLESSRGDTSIRPLRSGCRPACIFLISGWCGGIKPARWCHPRDGSRPANYEEQARKQHSL